MAYVTGTYMRNIFYNESNGYTIGVLKVKDTDLDIKKSNIYFVGLTQGMILRTVYTLYGEVITHPKYGKQFGIDSYEVYLPTEREELVEFLSSGFFPIGEKMAMLIVDKFGEKTLDVISNNPELLREIDRLSDKRIEALRGALMKLTFSSDTLMKLKDMGFASGDAFRLLNKYNDKILERIDNDIYDLVREDDMAFVVIDAIAMKMGIDSDDRRRVRALIIYLMQEKSFENGDTYLYLDEILGEVNRYIDISSDTLEILLSEYREVVIRDDRYYLKGYYDAEEYIRDRLCFLNDMKKRTLPNLEGEILKLEDINGICYDKIQRQAIIKAINNNLTIITGGPGTGKTTIIKAITYLLQYVYKAKKEDMALLAPTGRASKRMMETTHIPAYTIHRFLQWDKDSNTFNVNEKNVSKCTYVIVDEVSMIDTLLMESLLKGIRRDAKVILVGDYYQLPSVSPGQILKDLIDCELFDVVYLQAIYRQTEGSYILNLAQEIRTKELSYGFMNKADDYNFLECLKENVPDVIRRIVLRAIDKGYDERRVQILAPMYKTPCGIDNLNVILQDIFNPFSQTKKEVKLSEVTYRVGDKILQLVNDTENNVYNGDIGYIVDIVSGKKSKSHRNEIIASFDGNMVSYTPDKYINFKHGYAISVHKAQGSEFEMVIMPFVNSFNRMLYNKLVYTAVTRAKETLILVGSPRSFVYGVNNDYVDNRKTTLRDMIMEKYRF